MASQNPLNQLFCKTHQFASPDKLNRFKRITIVFLNYLFESIGEVLDYATDWMWTYNHERPNMALGGITPKQKLALST